MPFLVTPTVAILRARLQLIARNLAGHAELLPPDMTAAQCVELSMIVNDAGEFVRAIEAITCPPVDLPPRGDWFFDD
jgi:hypothetical protein